jgi:DNA-binding NarL/FixJ family response regulator
MSPLRGELGGAAVEHRDSANGDYPQSEPIRVLLVSDHALLREGLARLLTDHPSTEIVGALASVREATEEAYNVRPDVVIAEARLSDGTAVDIARHLRDSLPKAHVIMLCVGDEDGDPLVAVAGGVKGVLDRGVDATGLVGCIKSVTLGQFSISERLAGRMAAEVAGVIGRAEEVQGQDGALTERESEVLELVVAGLTNKAIADRLFLSESTVRSHMRSIMQKLNVENRLQAATCALRNHLTPKAIAPLTPRASVPLTAQAAYRSSPVP